MIKEIDFEVTVADGKYTYRFYQDGSSEALRRGQPWRDTVGDGFILAMAQRINELETAAAAEAWERSQ